MNFTKYEKYKDSGSDWLGEIPENWDVKRVKDIAKINPTTKSERKFDVEDKIDFLPMTNVDEVAGKIKLFNQVNYSEVKSGYTKFRNDDILFAKITPCMENGNCVIVENLKYNLGFGSTEFIIFRTNRHIDRRYFHHFVRNNSFRTKAEQFMIGTAGQKRISTSYLTIHDVTFPPIQIQTAIAEYLDEKTANIDKNIELLQAKKEKYRELRKTIINEAVTKGIDKNVELKDSGVEWLGKVPKHWEVVRSKNLFENVSIKNHPNAKLLSIYRDYGVIEKDSRDDNHNRASDDLSNYKFIKIGYLVINKMKAWQGSVGISNYDGIVSPAYLTCKPIIKAHNFYFHYLLRCTACITEFQKFSYGVRPDQWDLRYSDFADFMMTVPPIEEQKQIAEYLEEKTSKIDQIILTIDKNIEVLNEFRKTLINDAVTGKIKIAQSENTPYERTAITR